MLFKKAYVTNSICGPSRAVLLTGKYSHKNGFRDNENSSFDGSQPSFIKALTAAGYQTAWIGKWHLGTAPQGFTHWQVLPGQGHYFNPDFLMMDGSQQRIEGYATNIIEDLSERWLDSRDKTQPFCLVIGHRPLTGYGCLILRTWEDLMLYILLYLLIFMMTIMEGKRPRTGNDDLQNHDHGL